MSVMSDPQLSASPLRWERRPAAPVPTDGRAGWLGGDCVARTGAGGPTVDIECGC